MKFRRGPPHWSHDVSGAVRPSAKKTATKARTTATRLMPTSSTQSTTAAQRPFTTEEQRNRENRDVSVGLLSLARWGRITVEPQHDPT
jgi:hypothetical protein